MKNVSIDRRQLIRTAIYGIAGLSMQAYGAVLAQRGFTHGVASGEPAAKSVLLWTRHVSDGDSLLRVEIARDESFRSVVAGTAVYALAERDHTARVTMTGLAPDRWYFYRFIDSQGTISPVGRTRTLPIGPAKRFGVGVFSCSNLPFGHFNAYAHACDRRDLDLLLHLGDYIYEYRAGVYPDTALALPGREIQPSHEILTLADYRLRHANYRSDPDLQRLHSLYPMIAQWDDHELANDAWVDGAENHQPATEGDWRIRKAAALQAYHDWMPVSDANQAVYQIGTLASLIKVETRITGRSGPLELPLPPYDGGDVARALRSFRDDVWQDPSRSMMGKTQEQWLHDQLLASVRGGNRWQVLAQQVVVGELRMPDLDAKSLPPTTSDRTRAYIQLGVEAARQGLPFGFDRWDGFPAARNRLLRSAQDTESNLVVLSGDSHNAWGYDLAVDGKPAAVEFAGHSVTSPGYEGISGPDRHQAFETAALKANPSLKYCDTYRRGYMSLQLSNEVVMGSWHYMQTIAERNPSVAETHTMFVQRGRKALSNI